MSVVLLDENRNKLDEWTTGRKTVDGACEWSSSGWVTEAHQFNGYAGVPRFIQFFDSGKDQERWAGYYGPRIRESAVVLYKGR